MRNKQVLEITTLGILSAIIFIMAFVPWLGFIPLGFVDLTIIHIPVLVGGIFGGRRVAIGLGTAFGLASWSQALLRATGFSLVFQNPLIAVLPRILFGVAIYLLFVGFGKLTKNLWLQIALTATLSTLLHTLFVLSSFFVFAPLDPILSEFAENTPFFEFIWGVMLTNGFFEMAAALIIATPIVWRLRLANPFADDSL